MLTPSQKHTARQEFSSLRDLARITGEDLTTLIGVPPHVRTSIEKFCEANPADAPGFECALDTRDYMLTLLERNYRARTH